MGINRGEEVNQLLHRIDSALSDKERAERLRDTSRAESLLFGGEKRIETAGQRASRLPNWEKIIIGASVTIFAVQCAVYVARWIWNRYGS